MFRDKNTVRFHFAMWLGHWSPFILIGSMTYFLITAIYGRVTDDTMFTTWIGSAASLALTVFMMAALAAEALIHDANLCVKELDRAPLSNPQDVVDRHLRLLRMRHSFRAVVWSAAALIAWIAVGVISLKWENFFTLVLYTAVGGWLLVSSSTMAYARMVHRRLEPWCPWCRWGRGGGDDDDDPPPAPTGPATDARTDTR